TLTLSTHPPRCPSHLPYTTLFRSSFGNPLTRILPSLKTPTDCGLSDGKELSSFPSREKVFIKPASTTIAFPSRSTARSFGKRRSVGSDPPLRSIRMDDPE